jgi:hypothetical protein
VRAQEANESRLNRFSMCQRILDEDGRDWELLDIDPLLDGATSCFTIPVRMSWTR